ncbi:MAG: glycosyltransferase family 2 protein [Tepidisphaeraceae bacterium]
MPSISIVVPNYNGAATLAATLRCLVDQQYPGLEIIVVDGGSTDGSAEIIKAFEPHLAWWVSEKDGGQSEALNKGLARCTGEIVSWLCSDDLLTPGALGIVGEKFAADPSMDVLVGACKKVSIKGDWSSLWKCDAGRIELMPCCNPIPQSSCFFRRRLLARKPAVDESYHYTMDFELWCYFKSRGVRFGVCDEVLSLFQFSDNNKTAVGGKKIIDEFQRIYKTYVAERVPLIFWQRYFKFPVERIRQRYRNRAVFYLTRCYTGPLTRLLGLFYGRRRADAMNWEWIKF